MSRAALMAGYANPMIVVDGADFDGTNDYMTRGGGLGGAADNKSGIFSAWVRLDGGNGAEMEILDAGNSVSDGVRFLRGSTDKFQMVAFNAAGTLLVNIAPAGTYQAGSEWRHILASWNLATPIATMYISDGDLASGAPTDDTIDYTESDWSIGANVSGGNKFNGAVAELYFAPGQYLDFSLVANRRKFISASGKPVHLGAAGALPTAIAPLVYQHLDDGEAVANFATNRGTGGNFTITGTLDTGSTSPSD